jgi:hypothetical protein
MAHGWAGRALVIEKKCYFCAKILLRFYKKNKAMQQTMEEILKQYPDEWLILGSPAMSEDEQRILAAEVLYHGEDQLELVRMDKPLMKGHKLHAIIFNRVTPRSGRIMVGGRTLHSATATGVEVKHGPIKSIYQ